MLGYLPDLDLKGDVHPTFNTSDWKWTMEAVTFADLLEYAKTTVSNTFMETQYFTSLLFNVSINDVTETTFSYLKNVTSDIQAQFDTLFRRTTTMSYNSTNNRTTFTSTLATPVLILNNVNLNTRITTAETNVSSLQTKTTAQTYTQADTTTTFTGTLATPFLKLNGNDLGTRLTTDETNISTLQGQMATATSDISTVKSNLTNVNTEIDTLQDQLTTATSSISSLQTQQTTLGNSLATKANDSAVVHLAGSETISGQKNFTEVPTVSNVNVATTADISTAIGNLISSAPSTMDTLGEIATILQDNANSVDTILSSMVTLGGAQTVTGQKTFQGTTIFNAVSALALSIFQGIQSTTIQFSTSLNGIAPTVFAYLGNVTSDIQAQFNALFTKLTNYQYDSATSTQLISSSTAIQDTTTTNTLNANTIHNASLVSNNIVANSITCSSIKCVNLASSLPVPVVYLLNQGVSYPILKSGLMSNLTGINFAQPVYITIAPKHQLVFVDANLCALTMVTNPTDDFLHNMGVTFTTNVPTSFQVNVVP